MTSATSLVPATDPTEHALIKTDILGRLQRTPESRKRILDEYERSGLSGPRFAALCGVKYQTATWSQRRKRLRNAYPERQPQRKAATRVQWLEASVEPAAASTGKALAYCQAHLWG